MTQGALLVDPFVRSITRRYSKANTLNKHFLLNEYFLAEVADRKCFAEVEGKDWRDLAQKVFDECAVRDGTTKKMEEAAKGARYAVAYVRGRPESAGLTNPDDWDRFYSAAKRAAQALLHVGCMELGRLEMWTCDWLWGDFWEEVERAAKSQ